jgi:hypothetical protein
MNEMRVQSSERKILTRGKRNAQRETLPGATLSVTNVTGTSLVLNSNLRRERSTRVNISKEMASSICRIKSRGKNYII